MNLNFSKELCEIFNKDCKSPVNFIPSASSDSIGIRQLLDETGLHFNEIYFNDDIKDKCSFKEIINIIYVYLATGRFNYYYPTEKEMKLYKTLKENNWDIYLDKGELYIDEGVAVEDIADYEITKDYAKFRIADAEFYGYKEMIVTNEDNNEFNIEYIK
jgi:hypothetical protein